LRTAEGQAICGIFYHHNHAHVSAFPGMTSRS
jgi:hypothetical protein